MFIKLLEMCKRLLHLSISHNTPSCKSGRGNKVIISELYYRSGQSEEYRSFDKPQDDTDADPAGLSCGFSCA